MNARPNLVLGVVAGLVVVLAVVAGVLSVTRRQPPPDPATPEGTVQLFVLAVIDGDDAAAVARLDPALGCTAPLREVYRPARVSLTVVSTRTTGGQATVVLDVSEAEGGIFASSSHREVYELQARDPGWIITGHPWPVYACK